ncbi:MAG: DHH family phosphoesterase [Planctomycetaceae bacterium]|nr:DHH family phosphoesterase [Planctomycetaceae bacterium]
MNIDWQRFKHVVRQAKNIVLTSHIRPDCDALGSELGMAGLLEQLGKSVRIVNGQATPPNLQFIDPAKKIMAIDVDVTRAELANCDLVIILDTSAWIQLGPVGEWIKESGVKRIVVDHHQGEDDLDAELFKDRNAEATGAILTRAASELGCQLTPEIVNPLYAAIATDTGWFRFPSAKAECYRTAATLIEAGADPSWVYSQIHEQETLGRVRLRGVVLGRVQTELAGRLVHTWIKYDDFSQTGSLPSDTEDLINLALAIRGTEFAVIFVEQKSGGVKVSFRSRCAMNCNEIAGNFGGGGHKAAAGAFQDKPLAEVQPAVLDFVRALMN